MSYRFSRDETVGAAARRVMGELVDETLELTADPEPNSIAEAVHETRKNCKKGRGLVRLVRPALGNEYTTNNRALRDAARVLAPTRDPQALLQTFDDLIASAPDQVPDSGVLGVRQALVTRSERATETILHSESQRLDEARDLLESVGDRAEGWDLPDGFEPIGDGLHRTYKRGRKRLKDVVEAPLDTAYHEWRKRVKYLWYQLRLVRDSAPSILRALTRSLHDVSDALGDAHDLAILRDQMGRWDGEAPGSEVDAVDILAAGRKAELEERAISLGRFLYVEKPGRFVERLGGYWKAWRDLPPMKAGEIEDLFPADDELSEISFNELIEIAETVELQGRSSMTRDELESSLRAAGV